MKRFASLKTSGARIFAVAACWLLPLLAAPLDCRAEGEAFTNCLARGQEAEQRRDVAGALKYYSTADLVVSNDGPGLCLLTKRYCDLMHDTSAPATQETLAQRALADALRAVQTDPQNPTAHLCAAVGYVKNFPYADNSTKVRWSKAIKTECETAIALDPKQDVGYYLLGRWEVGVANMNFLLKGLVAVVYGGLPQASNAVAVKDFQKAIALAPKRIIHHAALADVYRITGEKKLARAELEKCLSLKPVDRDDEDAKQESERELKAICP